MLFACALLLLFSLIAFGGVVPVAGAVIEATAFTMAFGYMLSESRKSRITIVSSPVHAGALFFFALASYQLTGLPGSSIYRYATRIDLLRSLALYLFFFTVLNTVKSRKSIYQIAFSVLVFAVGLSFWGFAQKMAGITGRTGPFVNSNHYANWMLMATIFILGFFLAAGRGAGRSIRREGERKRIKQIAVSFLDTPQLFYLVLAVFSSVGFFFALSRGGIISFVSGLFFLAFLLALNRGLRNRAFIVLPFSLSVFLLILWLGANRIFGEFARMRPGELASDARKIVWLSTLDIFRDFPWTGTGLGTFAGIFPAYRCKDLVPRFFSHAHNEYLQLLAETGSLGFAIVFLCFAAFFVTAIRQLPGQHSRTGSAFAAASIAAALAGVAHAFSDFPFRIPANSLLFALIMAVATVTAQGRFSRDGDIRLKKRSFSVRNRTAFTLLLSLVYLFLVFSAFRPVVADRFAPYNPETAARIEPGNALYHFLAAQKELEKAGPVSMHRALPRLLKAVKLDPYNARYRQSLGWLYANMGYPEKAERELSLAVRLDPTNPVRIESYRHWFPHGNAVSK